jgi:tripeptide aminopeptidase
MIDDFIKYTKIDTTADPESKTSPSTPGQLELAKIVADDLKAAGLSDVELTEGGFIYATIPDNLPDSHPAKGKVPTLGLFAHVDTANEASGKDVKARFVESYQGGEITFPGNPELKLNYENAPHLKNCIGHTIITSDGTTLLGGDDKAGLAVLVELVRYFKENPDALHGKIRIAIIPDEEIGVGTDKLDFKKFGADIAYTLDAGEMGEIDVESFNGFKGKIAVEGYPAFPGYGKNIYINAIQVLSKFVAKMEDKRWPQNAAGRDPIWWVHNFNGDVGKAEALVFLRDFDLEGIEDQKKILSGIKEEVQKEFPKAKIEIETEKMYMNYKYELEKDPRIVEYAEEAMKRVGITPKRNFVRGGNDSCHLCFNGLLSTNIFVGMQNMHSVMEWNTVETIEGSLKTVVALANVWVEKSTS